MITDNRLIQATINALLVHLLLFGGLLLVMKLMSQQMRPPIQDRAIQVTQIPPELLKKYRTVGVQGGKKQFTLKTPKGAPVSKSKKKNKPSNLKAGEKGPKNLSFKNLQAKVKESDLPPDPQKQKLKNPVSKEVQKTLLKKEITAAENGVPLTSLRSSQALENFKRQEIIRRDLSKSLGTQSRDAEILNRTGFNLHFEPPEGVSEDELNSVEKIFYSFQKKNLHKLHDFIFKYLSTNPPQQTPDSIDPS